MIRRNFIKTTSLAGLAFSALPSYGLSLPDSKKVKIGFIGTGGRGRSHIKRILRSNDVEIPAICDIDPVAVNKSLAIIKEAGFKKPEVYSDGEFAFEK